MRARGRAAVGAEAESAVLTTMSASEKAAEPEVIAAVEAWLGRSPSRRGARCTEAGRSSGHAGAHANADRSAPQPLSAALPRRPRLSLRSPSAENTR